MLYAYVCKRNRKNVFDFCPKNDDIEQKEILTLTLAKFDNIKSWLYSEEINGLCIFAVGNLVYSR